MRGRIGVRAQRLTDHLARAFELNSIHGALISNVFEGGPADVAGIKVGDVITHVDERKVDTAMQLRLQIAKSEPEKNVLIEVLREGQVLALEVMVEKRMPSAWVIAMSHQGSDKRVEGKAGNEEIIEKASVLDGLEVKTFTADLAKKYGHAPSKQGILITKVTKDSLAEQAGLQVGMEVLSLDQKPVSSVEEWKDYVSDLQQTSDVLLWVEWRGERRFYPVYQDE